MDHLALLEHEVVAMTTALAGADLSAPVAACPGWTVADLAAHLSAIHRWAQASLGSDTPPPYAETKAADPVQDYADAARDLLTALRETPADAPAWTFDRSNRTAGFWCRRQVHEVAVHRWDVQPYAMSEEVALDGIDEVLTFFTPRQVALGRTVLPDGGLQLESAGRSWAVGVPPYTVVEDAPDALLLRLWGRGEPLPEGWSGLTP